MRRSLSPLSLLLTSLSACGVEPIDIVQPATEQGAPAALSPAVYASEWSQAKNLGASVNSPFQEFTPDISPDGNSLYFASIRPGGFGAADLWVSRRESSQGLWGEPINLGATINTPGVEATPHLSTDGHRLYFATDRSGGVGQVDIWVSWRAHVDDDLGWEPPVHLGSEVNSATFDADVFERRPEFYITSRRLGGLSTDIIISRMRGNDFDPATPVPELSSPGEDQSPSLRSDGREVFLSSNREGSTEGSLDLWVAYRQGVSDAWGTPTRLGVTVNTEYQDQQPALSRDGRTMYFASDRPGGLGGLDVYVTHR